jgi:hypothetical protein
MQCEEFEPRINELLDERQQPRADARLAEHARECAACADMLAGYEQTLDIVRGAAPLEMDTDPAAEIVARVQLATRRRMRLWTTVVPLAVAASLLIALMPAIQMYFNQPEVEVADSTKSESDTPHDPPHKTDSAVVVPDAAPPNDPNGADIVRLAFDGLDAWEELKERLETEAVADPSGTKWADRLKPLKPLTDTMAAALSAMGRTLPNAGGEEPPSS